MAGVAVQGRDQGRRGRWALSFADLCLLLLGFFVLLQANERSRQAVLQGVSDYFGAHRASGRIDIAARELFEPGEALLTSAGTARVAAIARQAVTKNGGIALVSTGQDVTGTRFDSWDLAAARLGAIARVLQAQGLNGERVRIRGLDEDAVRGAKGQQIGFVPVRTPEKAH